MPEENFLTTLTVRLQSKLTVTLRIQYGRVQDAEPRVIFSLPNRTAETQYVRDQTAKIRSELEATYADRLSANLHKELMRLLLEPHECARSSRRERKEDIVVEILEVCRWGNRRAIRFNLENRHRSPFNIGDVAVQVTAGKDQLEPERLGVVFQNDTKEVPFQSVVGGVVLFDVSGGDGKSYQLAVHEEGGKGRVVPVANVGL